MTNLKRIPFKKTWRKYEI